MRNPLDLRPVLDGLRQISEVLPAIRDSVVVLPEVAASLANIEAAVQTMGEEVHRMRLGVDELTHEVKELQAGLETHLDRVGDRVARLEPMLDEMSLAIHPLRRATGRLGRRGRGNGEAQTDGGAPDSEVSDAPADQISSGENVSQAEGSAEE